MKPQKVNQNFLLQIAIAFLGLPKLVERHLSDQMEFSDLPN